MEWIRLVHDDEFGLHRQDGTSTSSFSGVNIENSLQQMQNVVGGVMNQSKAALANVGRSLHISGTMTSSAANSGATGNVADGTEDASMAQLQLGQSSSWTIESSSSSDTLSPLAKSHEDVEAGTAAGGDGSAPVAAPTTGGRKSNSLMSANNDSYSYTKKSRTSLPTEGIIRHMPMVLSEKLPMHGRLSSHAQLTLVILSAIVDRLDEDTTVSYTHLTLPTILRV